MFGPGATQGIKRPALSPSVLAGGVGPSGPVQPLSFSGVHSANMTPQEMNLYMHHLYNAANVGKGGVRNPDGSVSTVYQMTARGPDGRTYSVPTVFGGRIVSPRDVVEGLNRGEYGGWGNWPAYKDEVAAQSRYDLLHQFMARDVN